MHFFILEVSMKYTLINICNLTFNCLQHLSLLGTYLNVLSKYLSFTDLSLKMSDFNHKHKARNIHLFKYTYLESFARCTGLTNFAYFSTCNTSQMASFFAYANYAQTQEGSAQRTGLTHPRDYCLIHLF